MIWAKLVFGGFGRRGLEALVVFAVLSVAVAIVAAALMVIEGARNALARAERNDRPDIVQVKSRFNRAVFETPRSGYLPPLTIPIYEPLIDPAKLGSAGRSVIARQSFLRNVVSGDSFLNLYIFGIEPDKESQVSTFSLARGRFLRRGDGAVAVMDQGSARALGVDIGGSFPVRKADGRDLKLIVVGVLDWLEIRDPPPRTIEAPALAPNSSQVSSGVFVTLRTSEEIFGRTALTDALIVAAKPEDVPSVVERLRSAFRLEPGVFISEHYREFRRKVRDFALTLALFSIVAAVTAALSGSFAANLLHDVSADRRRQDAVLVALGFSPVLSAIPGVGFALAMAGAGAVAGSFIAVAFTPRRFAMPSLMADLGTLAPRFNGLVGLAIIGMPVAAVVLGVAPAVWRIYRGSVAAALSERMQ
jgi:hypothetical protein